MNIIRKTVLIIAAIAIGCTAVNAKDEDLLKWQQASMKEFFELVKDPQFERRCERTDNGLKVILVPNDDSFDTELNSEIMGNMKKELAQIIAKIFNVQTLADSGFELEVCVAPRGSRERTSVIIVGDSWIANTTENAANDNNVDMSILDGVNIYDNQIPSDLPQAKDLRQKPKYPGGANTMLMWIIDNMVYPQSAMERNMQGVVQVDFIIETDGSITHPYVSQPLDPDLDREAMRLVKMMPKWTPAANGDDVPVRCRHTLPISFIFETM